jgi:hypothetical protein
MVTGSGAVVPCATMARSGQDRNFKTSLSALRPAPCHEGIVSPTATNHRPHMARMLSERQEEQALAVTPGTTLREPAAQRSVLACQAPAPTIRNVGAKDRQQLLRPTGHGCQVCELPQREGPHWCRRAFDFKAKKGSRSYPELDRVVLESSSCLQKIAEAPPDGALCFLLGSRRD